MQSKTRRPGVKFYGNHPASNIGAESWEKNSMGEIGIPPTVL